jgi:hypothetical protein
MTKIAEKFDILSEMRMYSPKKAWIRAGIYFAFSLLVGWASGVLQALLQSPVVSEAQLSDLVWWASTALVTAYVLFAYCYFWPKGTVDHGRSLHLGPVLLFGFLWGACQGQLVLAMFRLVESAGLAAGWNVLIMFIVYSVLTAAWHSRFWDVYVAPDHNIFEWNARKVLVAHVPFLLLALTHLAIFNNALVFVAWQIMALTASTYVMRFPAPGDPETPAHDGQGIRRPAG